MTVVRSVLLTLVVGVLLSGCGTTDSAETRTTQHPSTASCQAQHEACKDNCRQPENANSQGACFNQCLKSLQGCQDQ